MTGPLEDVTNRFLVGGVAGDRVVIAHPFPQRMTKQDALNLCAWLSVLAGIEDEDLVAARRQVEAT